MTHVRRPNRRRIPWLDDLVNGGTCPASGKVRYVDERTAQLAVEQIGRQDPDAAHAAQLGVYRHAACGDWHIGHSEARS